MNRYALELVGEKYAVTVQVGSVGNAFCTCRTFSNRDFGNRFRFPIRYYGATGIHGCQHVDAIVAEEGWASRNMTATEVMLLQEAEERGIRELRFAARSEVDRALVSLRKRVDNAELLARDANRLASRAANHSHGPAREAR